MALIIETGAIVAGADSFATVSELRAFAAKRGASLPAAGSPGDEACEVLLIKAMDYLQSLSERFKGEQVQRDQPLCWPRYGVVVSRYELPSDTIPADIKSAQMQLAIEAQTMDLMPTINPATQRGAVTEKTVGPLTTKYAEPSNPLASPSFGKVSGLLSKFMAYGANQVRVVRA